MLFSLLSQVFSTLSLSFTRFKAYHTSAWNQNKARMPIIDESVAFTSGI